jgi:hypothetical protein
MARRITQNALHSRKIAAHKEAHTFRGKEQTHDNGSALHARRKGRDRLQQALRQRMHHRAAPEEKIPWPFAGR